MARKAFIAIAFLLVGCPDDVQNVETCRIDVLANQCHCAVNDDEYQKPLEYCDGYLAAAEDVWRRIGNRLEQCRRLEDSCK